MLANQSFLIKQHGVASIKNRAEFWNVHNPGYLFLTEARRLWEVEADRPRLTTVQAACAMAITYTVNGVDKVGNSYLMKAVAMAQDMKLFSPSNENMGSKMRVMRTVTAWGIYSQQGYVGCQTGILATPRELR
jgi:hypothetical protein